MNTLSIVVILILLSVAVGIFVWMMSRETEKPLPEITPEIVDTPTPEPIPEMVPPPVEAPPVEEKPLTLEGKKYLRIKSESGGIIYPVVGGKNFEINSSGERSERMVIKLELVPEETDVYFLYSPKLKKYVKYSNNGFGLRTSKPTTYQYKIKFTKIGDDYAMSYINDDGKEIFFGYDGETGLKTHESVTNLLSGGLVTFEDADVSGFILPGNFGNDIENFTEYGAVVDDDEPIKNIQGCVDRLGDVDLDDEYRESLLSVAYNKDATEAPCRVYPKSDSYTYDSGATGWVTKCLDKTKSVKQGCLI